MTILLRLFPVHVTANGTPVLKNWTSISADIALSMPLSG